MDENLPLLLHSIKDTITEERVKKLMPKKTSPQKALLILEDGSSYGGYSFGSETKNSGEVVFNTGMVGYPETLTDPSYRGQILILTYPLIGNYGVPDEKAQKDKISTCFESRDIQIRGLVVSEYSDNHNHWNANQSLSKWLEKYGVPGISGIDTRALTRKLREKGTMLGKIVPDYAPNDKDPFYDPNTENIVHEVSVKHPQSFKKGRKSIVLIDCGMKNNILRNFLDRNITVHLVPWNYDFPSKKLKYDGVFISNGPGDPAVLKETHEIVRECLEKKIPTFGICLGNQILGIAAGAETYKMKYGHRSQNQPVIDLETGRCYITSQNHGFSLERKTVPKDWNIWFENLNDRSIEGIKHKKLPFMSIQFHPEATPGPIDTGYLFDRFAKLL